MNHAASLGGQSHRLAGSIEAEIIRRRKPAPKRGTLPARTRQHAEQFAESLFFVCSNLGCARAGDFSEVELNHSSIVVAIPSALHLEDLVAQVTGQLAPFTAGLLPNQCPLRLLVSSGDQPCHPWTALGVEGRTAGTGMASAALGARLAVGQAARIVISREAGQGRVGRCVSEQGGRLKVSSGLYHGLPGRANGLTRVRRIPGLVQLSRSAQLIWRRAPAYRLSGLSWPGASAAGSGAPGWTSFLSARRAAASSSASCAPRSTTSPARRWSSRAARGWASARCAIPCSMAFGA